MWDTFRAVSLEVQQAKNIISHGAHLSAADTELLELL